MQCVEALNPKLRGLASIFPDFNMLENILKLRSRLVAYLFRETSIILKELLSFKDAEYLPDALAKGFWSNVQTKVDAIGKFITDHIDDFAAADITLKHQGIWLETWGGIVRTGSSTPFTEISDAQWIDFDKSEKARIAAMTTPALTTMAKQMMEEARKSPPCPMVDGSEAVPSCPRQSPMTSQK